jgi:hypothetical protein
VPSLSVDLWRIEGRLGAGPGDVDSGSAASQPDAQQQLRIKLTFTDISACATLHRQARVVGRLLGREQDDDGTMRTACELVDAARDEKAVRPRHVDVHQHQVRPGVRKEFESVFACVSFGAHFESVNQLDRRACGLAESNLIVDDEHPHWHESSMRRRAIRRTPASTPHQGWPARVCGNHPWAELSSANASCTRSGGRCRD